MDNIIKGTVSYEMLPSDRQQAHRLGTNNGKEKVLEFFRTCKAAPRFLKVSSQDERATAEKDYCTPDAEVLLHVPCCFSIM
jgi:hypothetical protein